MLYSDRIKDEITKWYQLWKRIFVLTGNEKEIKNGFAKINFDIDLHVCVFIVKNMISTICLVFM
jgi:hypothetical protein